jgi:thiol-disulfide isomerase/thioredoxin
MMNTKQLLALSFMVLGVTTANASFTDVNEDTRYAPAIDFVQSTGIVEGYADGSFKPAQEINRAEFLKIVVGATFDPEVIAACDLSTLGFSDVTATDWFAPFVCQGQKEGIIEGYADGTFKPANTVNYAESAKIVLETANQAQCPKLATVRLASDAPWFTKYIVCINDLGYAPNSTKATDSLVSRGEMAFMITGVKKSETDMAHDTKDMTDADPLGDGEHSDTSGAVGTQPETETDVINTPVTVAQAATYVEYSDTAYESAKEDQIPFVLNFDASWCPTCQLLSNKITAQLGDLPANTLVFKVDYDTATDLRKEFGITQQTSGVFFDANGNTNVVLGTLSYEKINDFFVAATASAE